MSNNICCSLRRTRSILLIRRNYTWDYNPQRRESSNLSSNWLAIMQKESVSIRTQNNFKRIWDLWIHTSGSSKIKVNLISFANIFVSFTSAYGAKAIGDAQERWKFFKGDFISKYASRTSLRRKENLTPYYDCNAASYISRNGKNNQLYRRACKQLTFSIDNVNECARYLIKELLLTNSYIDSEIIKLTFRGNKEDIKHCMKTQIKNLSFL